MNVSCLSDDVESGSLDHVPFVGAETLSHCGNISDVKRSHESRKQERAK